MLRTKRLCLYAPKELEELQLERWLDASAMEICEHRYPADHARRYLRETMSRHWGLFGFGYWLVCPNDTQTPIGIVSLRSSTLRVDSSSLDLGFHVSTAYRGIGIGLEATQATLQIAFASQGLLQVHAQCKSGNDAAKALLYAHGFAISSYQTRFNQGNAEILEVWTLPRTHFRERESRQEDNPLSLQVSAR